MLPISINRAKGHSSSASEVLFWSTVLDFELTQSTRAKKLKWCISILPGTSAVPWEQQSKTLVHKLQNLVVK
jgi:hypothetical protein